MTQLIDEMVARSSPDLVRDFSWELPVLVIMRLIGAPDEDFDRIKQWSDGQIALIWGQSSEAEQVALAEALVEFWAYCQQLVAERGREPREDVVSTLIRYRGSSDEVITLREIASIAFNLLVAGHETTSNLLSNGMSTCSPLMPGPSLWRTRRGYPMPWRRCCASIRRSSGGCG